jgi:hypothetical protein
MPYFDNGYCSDNIHATRAIQTYMVRQDTLNTQSLPQNFGTDSIAALWNFLKTQTTVTFPSTAQIEGFWRAPGQDGVLIQVWDSSFATVAQNDIVPVNVV